jgi:hypothetical protein
MSLLLGIVLVSFFSIELFKMFVVDTIGDGDHPPIELLIAGLAAADEQNRRPPRIEGVENPARPSTRLNSQLPHVPVLGAADVGAMWKGQRRTSRFEKVDSSVDGVLDRLVKLRPPVIELIRELDIPGHDPTGILLHSNP